MHTWTFDPDDVVNATSASTPLPQRLDSVIYLMGFARQQLLPATVVGGTRLEVHDTALGEAELKKLLPGQGNQFTPMNAINWGAVLAFLGQLLTQLAPIVGG